MDWREYIHSDPEILFGLPVIKGTRLTVDFLFRLLIKGWTEQQILENYPVLTPEALQAIYAFEANRMEAEYWANFPAEPTDEFIN